MQIKKFPQKKYLERYSNITIVKSTYIKMKGTGQWRTQT